MSHFAGLHEECGALHGSTNGGILPHGFKASLAHHASGIHIHLVNAAKTLYSLGQIVHPIFAVTQSVL